MVYPSGLLLRLATGLGSLVVLAWFITFVGKMKY